MKAAPVHSNSDSSKSGPGSERDGINQIVRQLDEVLNLSHGWRRATPEHVLNTLNETLARILRLTFIYAVSNDAAGAREVELFHADAARASFLRAHRFDDLLAPWLASAISPATGSCSDPFDGSGLRIAAIHLGTNHRFGTLITAAQRIDYPSASEMVLLRVAVNQVSAVLAEQVYFAKRTETASEFAARMSSRAVHLLRANRELKGVRDELTAELGAMADLHEFSARQGRASDLPSVLNDALDAVMELQGANFGNVQLYDSNRESLVIVAHRNLSSEFLSRFALARGGGLACGRSLSARSRVVIEDVDMDEDFAPYRDIAASVGFRSLQSTPLVGHRGNVVGVLSTHFSERHRPSEFELRMTDLYCQYIVQMIDRKSAEEERSKLASIVENSADFIGIASLAEQALFLNPAGRSMVALEMGETLPERIDSYLSAKDVERLPAEIWPALERCGFWEGETSLRHLQTGEIIPVLQHIFFLTESPSGARLALATVCRDIRERRRAEREADEARRELSRATRFMSLGEISTSIAHEINQPLAAIAANGAACMRWLQREVPNIGEARASLDRIIRDANRASEVILRVRAFATKASLTRSPLSVNEIIREVLSLTHNELERETVTLRTQLANDLPAVVADRVELQQVVMNLVINAIEAMRPVVDRPRVLSIRSTCEPSSMIEVSVSDNGNGIPAGQRGRLFETFFTTKPQGMGLGLSISRRIVEALRGGVAATANPDHGMTISFTLPIAGPS
jgi:signal transduction histidine kinase